MAFSRFAPDLPLSFFMFATYLLNGKFGQNEIIDNKIIRLMHMCVTKKLYCYQLKREASCKSLPLNLILNPYASANIFRNSKYH